MVVRQVRCTVGFVLRVGRCRLANTEKRDREVKMDVKEQGMVEGAEHTDAVLGRVLRQRERHRGRSIFVRVGIVIAGSVVSVVAAPLSLPAPGLGLPLLIFGLRLLALEFDWAARLYVRVEKFARSVLGWLKRLLKSRRRITAAVVIGPSWPWASQRWRSECRQPKAGSQ